MSRILIVDDDLQMGSLLLDILGGHRHVATFVHAAARARELADTEPFDLVLVDVELGEGQTDGLQLLQELKERNRTRPVIILTGHGSKDRALTALRLGAQDFIEKPFVPDELLKRVDNALLVQTGRQALEENAVLKAQLQVGTHFAGFVGTHATMQAVYRLITRAARTDATVLVLGESGTGKELVARALHAQSRRAAHPFIAINCAALPENLLESELFGHKKGAFTGAAYDKFGLLQAATGGTVFLDEIGSMPLPLQSKLLRFLQDRELRRVGDNESFCVDVRVITATNESLEERIATRQFREDLYYRLSVIPITVPPLRARAADIPLLVAHFLKAIAFRQGSPVPRLAAEVMPILQSYSWPGNVRELQNILERVSALCNNGTIERKDLPPDLFNVSAAPLSEEPPLPASSSLTPAVREPIDVPAMTLKEWVRLNETAYIERVLGQADGNREKAARVLGISSAMMARKLHLLPVEVAHA
jgi:DNA-binding NtrC family response regulator